MSSLAIGINGVIAEAALEIARLPGMTFEQLSLAEDALRLLSKKKSVIPLREVQDTLQDVQSNSCSRGVSLIWGGSALAALVTNYSSFGDAGPRATQWPGSQCLSDSA